MHSSPELKFFWGLYSLKDCRPKNYGDFPREGPPLPQWKICMPSQLWITKRILTVNGGRSACERWKVYCKYWCMEYKEVLSNTKEYRLKNTLLHEWGERREMVSQKGISHKQWKQWYLSQAMKTMKLTWNKTITYNRARDGNTNAMGPIQGNGVYLSCKAKGFPTNPNYYYCYCV